MTLVIYLFSVIIVCHIRSYLYVFLSHIHYVHPEILTHMQIFRGQVQCNVSEAVRLTAAVTAWLKSLVLTNSIFGCVFLSVYFNI